MATLASIGFGLAIYVLAIECLCALGGANDRLLERRSRPQLRSVSDRSLARDPTIRQTA